MIDTHAHLNFADYDDLAAILQAAKTNQINTIIVPSSHAQHIQEVITLTEKYSELYGAIGIHPHYAKDYTDLIHEELKEKILTQKIVAIGEIAYS